MLMIRHISREYNYDNLSKPAVVFAPHPDDETLGCGGTIIKKKRAGADVKIVFMTDGSKSHKLLDEDELKVMRTREGIAAGQSLGLRVDDMYFLAFKDSKLNEHMESATTKVLEILQRQQPDEIFIPYYKEPHSDHMATNKIVGSAVKVYGREVTLYEYPISFWYNCLLAASAFTNSHSRLVHAFLADLKESLLSSLSLLMDFRCSVYIGDVIERKRAALDQHKSQMTRLIPNHRWWTLNDLLNGKWLKCFFQEHEIFRKNFLT
jgi:LmbE family N-acetylglucosaminyl deacetylase